MEKKDIKEILLKTLTKQNDNGIEKIKNKRKFMFFTLKLTYIPKYLYLKIIIL